MMRVVSNPNGDPYQDSGASSEPWTAVLMAVLPFLLPTLVLLGPLLNRLMITSGWSPEQNRIAGSSLVSGLALFLLGALLAGWLRGFPRWTYPYLGLIVVICLLMANSTTPGLWLFGYDRGRERWGWLVWIPLLVVAVTAVLILYLRRPVERQLKLITNIWRDWTLLSFAIYGMFILGTWVSLDEIHSPWEGPVTAAGGLLLALGAAAYMRATSTNKRAAALLVGFSAAYIVVLGFAGAYWRTHGAGGLPRPAPLEWSIELRPWLFFALLLLSPALIVLLRRSSQRLRLA